MNLRPYFRWLIEFQFPKGLKCSPNGPCLRFACGNTVTIDKDLPDEPHALVSTVGEKGVVWERHKPVSFPYAFSQAEAKQTLELVGRIRLLFESGVFSFFSRGRLERRQA